MLCCQIIAKNYYNNLGYTLIRNFCVIVQKKVVELLVLNFKRIHTVILYQQKYFEYFVLCNTDFSYLFFILYSLVRCLK